VPGASWEEIQREANDLVATAAGLGATVRVVGSTGIRMHCAEASEIMDQIERPAKDLDLLVRSSGRAKLRSLLEQRGYVIDRDLLVAMEGQRFAFSHPERGVDVDVFVEKLEFCHTIELTGRWQLHPTTIPVEELLLQKLQVHVFTQCDAIDAAVLLASHAVGAGADPEEIDPRHVAFLLARDWGFHRDATANLMRVREASARDIPLPDDRVCRVNAAVDQLAEAIAREKKTMAWRMRARVGERVQWWEDVDERVETY
jgi:hypothetical protein